MLHLILEVMKLKSHSINVSNVRPISDCAAFSVLSSCMSRRQRTAHWWLEFFSAVISTDLDARGLVRQPLKIRKAVTSELVSVGMLPSVLSMARVAPPDFLTVHLDGRIIGHMRTLDIPPAVAHLRHCKVAKIADVSMLTLFTSSPLHQGAP